MGRPKLYASKEEHAAARAARYAERKLADPEWHKALVAKSRARESSFNGDSEYHSKRYEARKKHWQTAEGKATRQIAQKRRYQKNGCKAANAWARKNRHVINAWRNKRYREDPEYKLGVALRNRLGKAFKASGVRKPESSAWLTGCSIPELRQHIEAQFTPGMTLSNLGEWHIDHIIPVYQFDLRCPLQVILCFHYTNLRPLWGHDNQTRERPRGVEAWLPISHKLSPEPVYL